MLRIRVPVLLFGGALSFAFAACGQGTGECTSVCKPSAAAVECSFAKKSSSILCGPDVDLATAQCQQAGGSSWVPLPVCEDDSAETTGEDPIPTTEPPEPWPPDGAVDLDVDSGEYVIDQDIFEALHDDLAPLQHSGTRLGNLDSGHFYVAAEGTLSEAMGWQLGDVFLSLNGDSLQGLDNIGAAYGDISHETHYTLALWREQSTVVIRYRVE